MRVRIKFAKFDTQRFLGHLDVMRYFQKLFNRSGLPVKYSEGYHPHQILSFAQPLGLGITSDGEYLDMELSVEIPCDEILQALRNGLSHGYEIIECVKLADRQVNEKLVTSMSLITRANYYLILKDGSFSEQLKNAACQLMSDKDITVLKKTKKGEKEIDIRPFIYEIGFYNGKLTELYVKESVNRTILEENLHQNILHAPSFENETGLMISLSAGSDTNISPYLFISALINKTEINISQDSFRIHRMELLGGKETESVPLCKIL